MSPPVFFYPHAYLRDRHLDTIRSWPDNGALNKELADNRQPSHVSKARALEPGTSRSWKQRLPLINIKKRPKAAPEAAVIYAWGAIVRPGQFILDLDNPYALTGYNVKALRLYRPVLRYFLLSPDCLEIRCLSKACRETLALTLGRDVADKARLCYPALQSMPPSAPSDGGCRFLFVSSQFDIKGGAALLRAFSHVRDQCPDATLDMVTYLPEAYYQDAKTIEGLTIHNADMPRQDIFDRFMAHADVLVHPTYADSFGMVLLEAMAHNMALIATDLYAIPEMLHDGANGILLRHSPLSIWNGVRAGEYFSDIPALKTTTFHTDTAEFEDEITAAMVRLGSDASFRAQCRNHTTDIFSCLMQKRD